MARDWPPRRADTVARAAVPPEAVTEDVSVRADEGTAPRTLLASAFKGPVRCCPALSSHEDSPRWRPRDLLPAPPTAPAAEQLWPRRARLGAAGQAEGLDVRRTRAKCHEDSLPECSLRRMRSGAFLYEQHPGHRHRGGRSPAAPGEAAASGVIDARATQTPSVASDQEGGCKGHASGFCDVPGGTCGLPGGTAGWRWG